MELKAKHKGARVELAGVVWLLDQGYEVFRNVSQHGPIDLVAIRDGEVLFIDTCSKEKALKDEQQTLGVKILTPTDGGFVLTPGREKRALIKCRGCEIIILHPRPRKEFCSRSCKNRYHSAARRSLEVQPT